MKRIRKALVTGIAVLALIPTSGAAYAADADSTYEGGLLELSRLSDGKKTPSELDQAISEWAEHSGMDKQQILDYELASVTGRIPATTGGRRPLRPHQVVADRSLLETALQAITSIRMEVF